MLEHRRLQKAAIGIVMTCSDPDASKRAAASEAFLDAHREQDPERLPVRAQQTLSRIADALGVTTALLKQHQDGTGAQIGDAASLAEASALLQAFIRIEQPEERRRCLAFVQDAAGQA